MFRALAVFFGLPETREQMLARLAREKEWDRRVLQMRLRAIGVDGATRSALGCEGGIL